MPLDDAPQPEVEELEKLKCLLDKKLDRLPDFARAACRRRHNGHGQAEIDDYVQAVYLGLFENDYQGLKSFLKWFKKQCGSECNLERAFESWLLQRTDWHIGHDLRRQRRTVNWEDAAIDPPSAEPNAEERLIAEAERHRRDAAIRQLSENDRTVFELRCQGLNIKQIAERTGRTPGATRKRLSDLKKKLRRIIEGE